MHITCAGGSHTQPPTAQGFVLGVAMGDSSLFAKARKGWFLTGDRRRRREEFDMLQEA